MRKRSQDGDGTLGTSFAAFWGGFFHSMWDIPLTWGDGIDDMTLRSTWISMGSLSQTSIWLRLRGLSNALRRISCACHIVWKGCDDALRPCIQYAACIKRISQIIIIENMIQNMTSHKLWLVQSERQFNFRQRSGVASNRGNSMLCCSSRSGSFLKQAMSC